MAEKTYDVDFVGANSSYNGSSQKEKSGIGRAMWAIRTNLFEMAGKIKENELSKQLANYDIQCDAKTIKSIENGEIEPPEGFIDAFKKLMQLDEKSINNMKSNKANPQKFADLLSNEVTVSTHDDSGFASKVTNKSKPGVPLPKLFTELLHSMIKDTGLSLAEFGRRFDPEDKQYISRTVRGVKSQPPKLWHLHNYDKLLDINTRNQEWLETNDPEQHNGLDLKQTFYMTAYKSMNNYLRDKNSSQESQRSATNFWNTIETDRDNFFTDLQAKGILTKNDEGKIRTRYAEIAPQQASQGVGR